MNLTLTVIKSQPGGAAPGSSWTLEQQDAVIGRGAGSDWILPDPSSHLSKRHCVVVRTGTGFGVTDTSTNGVFLNGAAQALGHGSTAALADGDRLAIGDYVLEARVSEEAAEIVFDADDPFGLSVPPRSLPEPAVHTPFGGGGLEPLEEAYGRAQPIPEPAAPAELGLDPFATPLAAADFRPSAGGTPGLAIPEDIDLFGNDPLPDRPAAPPPVLGFAATGESRPDNLAAERAAFPVPRSQGDALPDSWIDDDRPKPERPPPVAEDGLLAAFAEGMGLSRGALDGEDAAAAMKRLGQAYREAALGLAEVLRNRTKIKAEFRIERTMIGAVRNNPLKFIPEPDAMLAAMTGAPTPGFQPPAQAFREGFRDVQAHELALVSAIQVALTGLLAQLDPKALTTRLERRSVLDLVGSRKARYWEIFEESYRTIAAELADDFQGVFGKAFAEAYERETGQQ